MNQPEFEGRLNEDGTYYIKIPCGTVTDARLKWVRYSNGDLALELWGTFGEVNECFSRVTTNLSAYDRHPAPGYIFVHASDENYKLYHALEAAGIVEPDAIPDIIGTRRAMKYFYHAKLTERALASLKESGV